MKKVVRVLSLSVLLVAAVQAAVPKHQDMKLIFSGGAPVPICDPDDRGCTEK